MAGFLDLMGLDFEKTGKDLAEFMLEVRAFFKDSKENQEMILSKLDNLQLSVDNVIQLIQLNNEKEM